jgi:hypothetical protein
MNNDNESGEYCFVIQPFDNDKFDRRYNDVFAPAITDAKITPYRVDKDPETRIVIEKIESKISKSALCFAEITTDNPNVWYELGFAFACNKDVVLVCCPDERKSEFPFDIRHRNIIKYKAASPSDFEPLRKEITQKIKAFQKSVDTMKTLNEIPMEGISGLKPHEIAFLILIAENTITNTSVALFELKSQMNDSGFTDMAVRISLTNLKREGFVKTAYGYHVQDRFQEFEQIAFCELTEKGEEWVLNNQDKFQIKRKPVNITSNDKEYSSESEELPF